MRVEAMTSDVFNGPAILVGYEYALQVEADAPLFPAGAAFTAQVRQKLSAATPITTLTSAAGHLVRRSDTVLEIKMPPDATALMQIGSAFVDVVRTDVDPPKHLSFLLEIPVTMPVTRGL